MHSVNEAAKAYSKMANLNYEFIVAKNRNSPKIRIVLEFDKSNFYHLCGLHDLKMRSFQAEKRSKVFDQIISGLYNDDFFSGNNNFHLIEDRIDCLLRLEEMLDSDDTIFKFNPRKYNSDTKIQCDYIIKNENNGRNFFYLVSADINGKCFGRSCFARPIGDKDFSKSHTYLNILYKAKIALDEHGLETERTTLYLAESFKDEFEKMNEATEIAADLQSPSAEFKKKKTDFSLLPERSENSFSFAPLCSSAGALAAVLPDPNRYNPLGELLKNVIAGLSDVSKKITEFLTAPLPSVHIGERKQSSQARNSSERKINYNIPFAKQAPSDVRSEPSAAKPERRSSWIDRMLSSAKREADENNSKHEIKSHDKDKSL